MLTVVYVYKFFTEVTLGKLKNNTRSKLYINLKIKRNQTST